MAQEDPGWTLEKEMATRRGVPHVPAAAEKVDDPHFQEAEASTICMGDRCEVSPGGKRGTVRYAASQVSGHLCLPACVNVRTLTNECSRLQS